VFHSKGLPIRDLTLRDINKSTSSFFYKLISNKPEVLANKVYSCKKNLLTLLPFAIIQGERDLAWFIIHHPLSSKVASVEMKDFALIQKVAFEAMLSNNLDLFTSILSMSPVFSDYIDVLSTSFVFRNFNDQDFQVLQAIKREKFEEQEELFNKIQNINRADSQEMVFTDQELQRLKSMLGDDQPLSEKLTLNTRLRLIDHGIQSGKIEFIKRIVEYTNKEEVKVLGVQALLAFEKQDRLFLSLLKKTNKGNTQKKLKL